MKKLLLLPALAALVSACSSTPSFTEDVTINSQPQGADVFVNNELVGQTPTIINLQKNGVYDIKLVKKGYKDVNMNVASVKENPIVKFGPLVDAGYYKTFEPSCIDQSLKPAFLPDSVGNDPFGELSKSIAKADEMRKSGEISPEEHSYMILAITEFFTKK